MGTQKMITITRHSICSTTLIAIVFLFSGSAPANGAETTVRYRADDGNCFSMTLDGLQMYGTMEDNGHGSSRFQAQLTCWTVQQPDGRIVQKEAYKGSFVTTLNDGRKVNGTLEFHATESPGVIEMRSTHVSFDNKVVNGGGLLRIQRDEPVRPAANLAPLPDGRSGSVTTDFDQFNLLPKEDLINLGL